MRSQAWRDKIADKTFTITIADFETAMDDWDRQVEELEAADGSWADAGDADAPVAEPSTIWGNCIRGCPPAYLDNNGACSPACVLGAPRGEFVTARPITIIEAAGGLFGGRLPGE